MNKNSQVAWIVDVQRDFMDPPEMGGRLYVRSLSSPEDPGAAAIKQGLAEACARWEKEGVYKIFTGDWHKDDDPEIDAKNPDFKNTFPPHCMGASKMASIRGGAELINEVRPVDPLILSRDAASQSGEILAEEMVRTGRSLFVQKHRFSVFDGNAAAKDLVRGVRSRLNDPEFLVCGVATDVCVKQAVEGLLDLGARVTVLTDLIWGLGIWDQKKLLGDWEDRGARLAENRVRHRTQGAR